MVGGRVPPAAVPPPPTSRRTYMVVKHHSGITVVCRGLGVDLRPCACTSASISSWLQTQDPVSPVTRKLLLHQRRRLLAPLLIHGGFGCTTWMLLPCMSEAVLALRLLTVFRFRLRPLPSRPCLALLICRRRARCGVSAIRLLRFDSLCRTAFRLFNRGVVRSGHAKC